MFRCLPSGSVNKLSFKLSFFDSFLFHVNDLSWPLASEHGLNRVGRGGGGVSGIPVYRKKIRQNTQKYPKFIQIYPGIFSGILYTWNSKKVIPYSRFKKPLYTVYPKTLADPDWIPDLNNKTSCSHDCLYLSTLLCHALLYSCISCYFEQNTR